MITIRQLTPSDEAVLDNTGPDLFDEAIDPVQRARFLADPRHVLIVALDGDLVVGFVSAVEYFHPDKPPQLWINEVGVAATHRGQGIGKQVLAAAFEEGRRRGCVDSWVGTEPDNTAARALYAAMPEAAEPETFLLYAFDLRKKN